MKRNLHLFLFCVLGCLVSNAQPSQAELDAMQKKLQKKMDSLMNDPKVKKYMNDPNNSLSGITPAANPSTDQYSDKDFEKLKLPSKDSAWIKSIPKKNYTPSELSSYFSDLYAELTKKLTADAVASANSIAVKLGDDPLKLEAAAMHGWEKGAIEESVLLITKAATQPTDDGLLLTNAGAILDMSGLSERAIPVLRTIVRYDPENAIAFNNLGQAFTALGMQDSAMFYFSRCLGLSPQHPEANNTAGVIELKKGNKDLARGYFENSIRGGFNVSAYKGLKAILKDKCRIAELIKPKVKLPEYFNQFKYKIPPQCLNVNEAATRRAEYDAFKKMLNTVMQQIRKIGKEAEGKMASKVPEMNKTLMEKAKRGESVLKPFQTLGSIMEVETILEYRKERMDLEKFNTENRKQYKDLEQEYEDAYEQLMKTSGGDGLCRREIELKNRYLPRFAQLNEEWQSRNMLVENKYIDDLLYWCYFSAFDEDDYRGGFYNRAYNYLYTVNRLAQVKILEPCEDPETEEIEKPEPTELKEFDCPVELEIPFLVGKFELDCEKVSFAAGEGITFKYQRNFTGLRQTTISIGVGAELYKLKKKIKGLGKASIEAGIGGSVFITMDKQGNVNDFGTQTGAKASAGIEFESGEKLKAKKEVFKIEAGVGVRLAQSSGLTLGDGPLKRLIDEKIGPKKEVQVNKNVKPYKPN